ncbi:immunity protein 7-domain-containing protein [Penicillium argentinense]|uniref:Immunity protein 7-domain-containing protein n=1 Tax=Penicillium argentinense TaxID=1131581 RepID=A0A9W9F7A0_9EURO|nr:immunity protein 7-domain-containing protein [Penicillium argentinense]KAJ5094941.1 immunity protein 7-domain-containing protein [Penicillium argentinense]
MHILAKVAGGEVDEHYDVLQAFFAEGADGSGLVMTFQRQLSAEEPWNGDPSTDDYFNNSYCITFGLEVVYGGLEQVSFLDFQGCFYFSDHAAADLGTGRLLVVDFEVSEQDRQQFQQFLREAVTWGVPSQIPQFNGSAFKSSIMEAEAPNTQPNEPQEGTKASNHRSDHLKLKFISQEQLDRERGNPPPSPGHIVHRLSDLLSDLSHSELEFVSQEQLDRERGNPPDDVAGSNEPSLEDIEYLSNSTPFQQKICDSLRGLGWIDTDICNFLIQLENMREHIRAELRMKGQSETDIQKFEDICKTNMKDFSYLRRSGANRALEEYQTELYLLHENKRQRRVMLNEE